jgi:hypothetical protein
MRKTWGWNYRGIFSKKLKQITTHPLPVFSALLLSFWRTKNICRPPVCPSNDTLWFRNLFLKHQAAFVINTSVCLNNSFPKGNSGLLQSSGWSLRKEGFLLTLTYMVQLTFPTCCRGSLHNWRARGCCCWYFPSWFPFSSFSLVSSLLDRHFLIVFSSFCFCVGIFLDLSIEMNLVLLFWLPQLANSLIQQDPTFLSLSSFWRLWACGRIGY